MAWYGYAVPRGTPQPVVEKIAAGFHQLMKIPKVLELLTKQGLDPMEPKSLSEIAALYADDTEKYAKVIREAGIKRTD